MTQPIPAIPTFYNGVQYRSRTEARTAVFLDYFGVRHEYEPRKYHLDGIVYIPDFWLPDYELWLEMKGLLPTPQEQEKARRLFHHEQHPVLIMSGVPYALERDMTPESDEEGYVDEGYDPTGLPDYACMLFAQMAEVKSQEPPGRMTLQEFIEHRRTPPEVIHEYYAEMTNVALVYCAECEHLCVAEHIFERYRDWYVPILGCSQPFRHVAEIELLDWKMQQAYAAAREVRF